MNEVEIVAATAPTQKTTGRRNCEAQRRKALGALFLQFHQRRAFSAIKELGAACVRRIACCCQNSPSEGWPPARIWWIPNAIICQRWVSARDERIASRDCALNRSVSTTLAGLL